MALGDASTRVRVMIVATHPIQYHVPWFQQLAAQPGLELRVCYAELPDPARQGVGFGLAFQWDIPLLEGYAWSVLQTAPRRRSGQGFLVLRLRRLGAVLAQMQPQVVIVTGWQSWSLVQVVLACRWHGIPCCVRGESSGLKPRPWWVRAIHRLLLRGYDAFLVIGKANRAFYSAYGVPDSRLFDAPYFVDNKRFHEQAMSLRDMREGLRSRWGIPAGAVCFCYVGKLEPKKRIMDLLRALERVRKRGSEPPLHLLVVGAGELEGETRRFVAQHGLPVGFAGFLNQSEIAQAYVAADCLVLPSDYGETWGLVVNEAMACGIPALVSDRVGCALDLIEEGKTGAVFPFADITALAGRLTGLAADPDHLRSLGEQARAGVLQCYGVDHAVAGTLAAIHALSGRRRA
ncbi:MAG: glycosyltransferase family 4 protein [Gammaproteobacteria bacterium]